MYMGHTAHGYVCIHGSQGVLLIHQGTIVAHGLETESLTGLGPPYMDWVMISGFQDSPISSSSHLATDQTGSTSQSTWFVWISTGHHSWLL